MPVLRETFVLLSILGLWKPDSWRGWRAHCYKLWTTTVVTTCYYFTWSQLMDLLFVTRDVANLTSNIAAFLAMVAVCGKIAGFLGNRETLIKIQQVFNEDPFKYQDEKEAEIQQRYNHFIRVISLAIIALHEVAGAAVNCSRIFAEREEGELPFRAWLPYNYSSTPRIWYISAAQQIVTVFISGHINAAFDLFFPGMMFLVCAQVNILKYRFRILMKNLEKITKDEHQPERLRGFERQLIGDWVRYHTLIISLSNFMHSKFSKVVFIQYSVSAVIICTTIYIMTNIPVASVEFAGNLLYVVGETFGIFIECVSANEATLEFADLTRTLYDTRWFNVSNNSRKAIVIIMSKCLQPIVFTCGYIFILTLDLFKNVIKVAYSIYNVIQQS